ncbi:MAG: hypothetical protein ABI647_06575 [Gemmatimonadota bacterium]
MPATASASALRPHVIVDFAVDDGLLTIRLKNIGERPAYLVKTVFDKPFHGLGGTKCISEMRVFRKLDFMPPGKEFSQFVDSLATYARGKQPMRIVATISYRDSEGSQFQDRIAHDLRVYVELGQARVARKEPQGD